MTTQRDLETFCRRAGMGSAIALGALLAMLAPLSPAFAGASSGTAMLTTASNAAQPAALMNLTHRVTPQAYGAKGDGVADDTAAIQAWLNELTQNGTTGFCPAGTYRLTASVNAYPAQSYKIMGAADACDFYIDYNSAWAGFAIDLTNPTAPTTRGKVADWSGIKITYNPALTAPPIAFGGNYVSGARLRDIRILQYTANRGTCLSFLGPFNFRQFANVEVWGCGGHASAHLVPAGTTFSIAAGSNTLTASASFFSAADVGTAFYCKGGTYAELFTVTGFTSATQVTVGRNASVAHTNVLCAASGVTGSITAGTNTLTISAANLSAADIGRIVYIPQAGTTVLSGTVSALRTTIAGVSGTTVTLQDNAGTTATSQPVILSPAAEIYGDQGANPPNDLVMIGFSLEENGGTPLVIRDCTLCFLYGLKSAALSQAANFGQTQNESDFNLAVFNSDVTMLGADIEGQAVNNIGRMLFEGMTLGAKVDGTSGVVTTGQPEFGLYANFFNAVFDLGAIHSDQRLDAAWATLANLVATDASMGGPNAGVVKVGPLIAYNSAPSLPQVLKGPILANTYEVSTADLVATSNTTLAIVPGLSQQLVAGATYNCAGHLSVSSGASGGLRAVFAATGGLTATSASFNAFAWNGTTAVANATATALGTNIVANTAVVTDLYVQGSITVGVGGTINLKAAQNASNGTSTVVKHGSTMNCVRVS